MIVIKKQNCIYKSSELLRLANIFGALLCLFVVSCNNQPQNDHDADLKRRAAQIREDKERAVKYENDKKVQNRIDSLAAIAWGDALFGMNKEEVRKTRAFGKGRINEYTIEMEYERKQATINTFGLKLLSSIRLHMMNDVVSTVYVDSRNVGPDEFDNLCADLIRIKNNFNRIYDSPKKSYKVSFTNFDSNGRQKVADYVIEGPNNGLTKNINIELQNSGYDYWYSITIYNSSTDRDKPALNKWIRKFNEQETRREDVELYSF